MWVIVVRNIYTDVIEEVVGPYTTSEAARKAAESVMRHRVWFCYLCTELSSPDGWVKP